MKAQGENMFNGAGGSIFMKILDRSDTDGIVGVWCKREISTGYRDEKKGMWSHL